MDFNDCDTAEVVAALHPICAVSHKLSEAPSANRQKLDLSMMRRQLALRYNYYATEQLLLVASCDNAAGEAIIIRIDAIRKDHFPSLIDGCLGIKLQTDLSVNLKCQPLKLRSVG